MSAHRVQSSTQDFRVPIKAWLKSSTMRILVPIAEERRLTVGDVLVLLAEQATKERTAPGRKPYGRVTPELLAEIVRLSSEGKSGRQIAAIVNVSQPTVQRHLKQQEPPR